ncbi:hypothetical protein HDU93_007212 [Gonapodya sp. JEL0774]|nr:hypothetical protein HDU93_007212 [Gonapodya sp. JEL0774]
MSIVAMAEYLQYSPEELRRKDYELGKKTSPDRKGASFFNWAEALNFLHTPAIFKPLLSLLRNDMHPMGAISQSSDNRAKDPPAFAFHTVSASVGPTSDKFNNGTGDPSFQATVDKDSLSSVAPGKFQTITAMDVYRIYSLEELRLRDYMLGKKPKPSAIATPTHAPCSFGQPTANTSLFGQPAAPAGSLFGQPAPPGGFFSQTAAPVGSLFGQPAVSAGSLFSLPRPPQPRRVPLPPLTPTLIVLPIMLLVPPSLVPPLLPFLPTALLERSLLEVSSDLAISEPAMPLKLPLAVLRLNPHQSLEPTPPDLCSVLLRATSQEPVHLVLLKPASTDKSLFGQPVHSATNLTSSLQTGEGAGGAQPLHDGPVKGFAFHDSAICVAASDPASTAPSSSPFSFDASAASKPAPSIFNVAPSLVTTVAAPLTAIPNVPTYTTPSSSPFSFGAPATSNTALPTGTALSSSPFSFGAPVSSPPNHSISVTGPTSASVSPNLAQGSTSASSTTQASTSSLAAAEVEPSSHPLGDSSTASVIVPPSEEEVATQEKHVTQESGKDNGRNQNEVASRPVREEGVASAASETITLASTSTSPDSTSPGESALVAKPTEFRFSASSYKFEYGLDYPYFGRKISRYLLRPSRRKEDAVIERGKVKGIDMFVEIDPKTWKATFSPATVREGAEVSGGGTVVCDDVTQGLSALQMVGTKSPVSRIKIKTQLQAILNLVPPSVSRDLAKLLFGEGEQSSNLLADSVCDLSFHVDRPIEARFLKSQTVQEIGDALT